MFALVDRVAWYRLCLLIFCVTLFPGCQGVMTQRSFVDDESNSTAGVDRNLSVLLTFEPTAANGAKTNDESEADPSREITFFVIDKSSDIVLRGRIQSSDVTRVSDALRQIEKLRDLTDTVILLSRSDHPDVSRVRIDRSKIAAGEEDANYDLVAGDVLRIFEQPNKFERLCNAVHPLNVLGRVLGRFTVLQTSGPCMATLREFPERELAQFDLRRDGEAWSIDKKALTSSDEPTIYTGSGFPKGFTQRGF